MGVFFKIGEWTKLMIVGGSEMVGKSELIDLSGQNLTCPPISDFPIQYGSVGIFINNKALVCGGYDEIYLYRDCYAYNMEVSIFFMATHINFLSIRFSFSYSL